MHESSTASDTDARHAQMFPVLTAPQIARVVSCGVEQSFADGDIVVEQGDTDVPLYVVIEGKLDVVSPRGKHEDAVTTHESGQFTGEVALLTNGRALLRARANGPTRVVRVESAALRSLVQTDSELSDLFMRAFILRRMAMFASGFGDAVIVGSQNSAATLRLQEFLTRNGHPYRYVDVERDPDFQGMLDELHVDVADIPILICRGEKVLRNPTDAEVADCLVLNEVIAPTVVHDLVVCGAGPGGLAAAVYGASEGLDVLVIEAVAPGGQAASSSNIENYLGFPTGVSGQDLAGRALAQAEKFGAHIAVARGAARLHCEETPLRIDLVGGNSVRARAVVIATGAQYGKLDVADLARFEGVGVYYAATSIEVQRCSADETIVVGGGNSAGQAATFLARSSRHVHLLVRAPDLAASMSRYLIRRIEQTPNITLHRETQVVKLDGDKHLEHVTWENTKTREVTTHAIRHVFSMIGAKPNTQWLRGCVEMDEKGFVRTGSDLLTVDPATPRKSWSLDRPPALFETSQPRVFAVGDVRSNSVKRVASAVGEGSICIQLVHRALAE